jgi:hypothetical protein
LLALRKLNKSALKENKSAMIKRFERKQKRYDKAL